MAVELRRGPTPEMRDWIAELGVIISMPIVEVETGNGGDTAPGTKSPKAARGQERDEHDIERAGRGDDKSDLVEGLGPSDIIPSLKDILGPLSATCKLTNSTE